MVPSETASQEPRLTLPADGGGERWVLDLARAFLGSVTASNRKGLRGRLQAQAEVLARLPGVGGAMVVSFDDEGAPVTSGAHRLTLRDDAPELEILSSLQRALTPRLREGAWVEVDLSQVSREQDGTAWALPVPSAPGLVLVLLDP